MGKFENKPINHLLKYKIYLIRILHHKQLDSLNRNNVITSNVIHLSTVVLSVAYIPLQNDHLIIQDIILIFFMPNSNEIKNRDSAMRQVLNWFSSNVQ